MLEKESKKLTTNNYSVKGYSFVGWATASYIPEEAEAMRDSSSPLIIKNGADTNLDPDFTTLYNYYALWTRNKYKVTLAKNESYNPGEQDPYLDTNNANKVVDVLYEETEKQEYNQNLVHLDIQEMAIHTQASSHSRRYLSQ